MGKPGFLVYKCRRCGGYNKSTRVPDIDMAVMFLAMGSGLPNKWGTITPALMDVHSCEDGNTGISDMIGGEQEQE